MTERAEVNASDNPALPAFTHAHGKAILALYRLHEHLEEPHVRDLVAKFDAAVNAAYEFGRASRGVGATTDRPGPTSQPPTSVSGDDVSRSTGAPTSSDVGPA